LLRAAGLAAKPRQWAPVDASLRSRRFRNVFVIGDAAGLPRPVAKQAFYALEMGEYAASNVQRMLAGRKLKSFSPSRTPLLVAFGDLDTFLVAGRSVISNSTLAAAKEAVYQVTMAQIDPPLSAPALGQLARRVIGVTRRLALSR
jgi:NADH dehydrogenase FAD-containing subunit